MHIRSGKTIKLRGEDIPSSEITDESSFLNRRKFLGASVALAGTTFLPTAASAGLRADDELTPEAIVTSYNNFYEFGTGKSDPAEYAHALTTDPWTVKVSGEANNTGEFAFEDIIKGLSTLPPWLVKKSVNASLAFCC